MSFSIRLVETEPPQDYTWDNRVYERYLNENHLQKMYSPISYLKSQT